MDTPISHKCYCPDCGRAHNRLTNEEKQAQLNKASKELSKIISKWPAWKQGILVSTVHNK